MTTLADFDIDKGSTFRRNLTIVDNNKTPLNLTQYTIKGQLRKNYTSLEFVDFEIIILNATTGKILLTLADDVTDLLIFPKYVYDVEIISPVGITTRILEGSLTISPNVTR